MKVPAYSDEKLRSFSVSDRHNIYKHARALGTAEALQLCERIEALGLPFSEQAALRQDDPITMRIYEIAFSDAASQEMKKAIEAGLPPIAALDPILVADLGVDYGPHNMSTNNGDVRFSANWAEGCFARGLHRQDRRNHGI